MLDVEGNRAHPQELYSIAGQLQWTRTVLRLAEQRAGCLPILRAALIMPEEKRISFALSVLFGVHIPICSLCFLNTAATVSVKCKKKKNRE